MEVQGLPVTMQFLGKKHFTPLPEPLMNFLLLFENLQLCLEIQGNTFPTTLLGCLHCQGSSPKKLTLP